MSEWSLESASEKFRFDSPTGKIYWRSGRRAGDEAGHLDNKGYRVLWHKGKGWMGHRVAWLLHYGKWPELTIDHINGVRDDNRIENLRQADRRDQMMNRAIPKSNTSGAIGVTWHKNRGYWQAGIQVGGKHIHLGIFENLDDAKKVRAEAEIKYGFHPNHGDKRP